MKNQLKVLSVAALALGLGVGISNSAMTNATTVTSVAVVDVAQVINNNSQVKALKEKQEKKSADLKAWVESARADVEKQGDRVFINIEGNRFLYNMVRTIVGTLLKIEGHDLAPEYMKMVLEACDRRKAGQTVSPYGLTLMKVDY